MVECQRDDCSEPVAGPLLYFTSSGIGDFQLCVRHLAEGRAAADLVGGEPVWAMRKWMDLTGRAGKLRRALAKPRPRMFDAAELPPLASGRGALIPLWSTQPGAEGVVVATVRRIVVVEAERRFSFRWEGVEEHATEMGSLPDDQSGPYEVLHLSFDSSGGGYDLLIKPENMNSWQRALAQHVPH